MILPIYGYGQPVLKKLALDIDPTDPVLEELIPNMWETMYNAHGVGLAGPQVGLALRIFLVDTEQVKDDEKLDFGIKKVFINALVYTLGRAISYTRIGLIFFFGASQIFKYGTFNSHIVIGSDYLSRIECVFEHHIKVFFCVFSHHGNFDFIARAVQCNFFL